jgi:bacterioferritin
MKGNAKVIDVLNDCLTAELTAINQYFIHARMCENWGYERLWHKLRQESIGEMKDADEFIQRILFLDGVPNMQKMNKINVGTTVKEQHQLDYQLELDAIARLNNGIEVARQAGDNGSRELLVRVLEGEEEHANWLEAQLALMEQVGETNYLAQQIKKDE